MLVTRIDESNIHLIMSTTKKSRKRDSEFLNALWQYVLCSKEITRILPFCKICHERGKFKFEGFGGIDSLPSFNAAFTVSVPVPMNLVEESP